MYLRSLERQHLSNATVVYFKSALIRKIDHTNFYCQFVIPTQRSEVGSVHVLVLISVFRRLIVTNSLNS